MARALDKRKAASNTPACGGKRLKDNRGIGLFARRTNIYLAIQRQLQIKARGKIREANLPAFIFTFAKSIIQRLGLQLPRARRKWNMRASAQKFRPRNWQNWKRIGVQARDAPVYFYSRIFSNFLFFNIQGNGLMALRSMYNIFLYL